MVIFSKSYILWLIFLLPITLPRRTIAMSIARDGYVFVPTSVDGATLDVLREEADHLFHLKKAHDALSEDEYFDKASTRADIQALFYDTLFSRFKLLRRMQQLETQLGACTPSLRSPNTTVLCVWCAAKILALSDTFL